MDILMISGSLIILISVFSIKFKCFKNRNGKDVDIEIKYLPGYYNYLSILLFIAGVAIALFSYMNGNEAFKVFAGFFIGLAFIMTSLTRLNIDDKTGEKIRKKALYLTLIHGLSIIIAIDILRHLIQLQRDGEFFGYYFLFFTLLYLVELRSLLYRYRKGLLPMH